MVTKDEVVEFFQKAFPQASFIIEELGDQSAKIRKEITREHLRPGNTVAGPVIMALADAALYVTILKETGLAALAVTTNLNINFLRKPVANKDLLADCKLLKTGRSLVIGEVSIYSDGSADPVAHAVGTYSIPSAQ